MLAIINHKQQFIMEAIDQVQNLSPLDGRYFSKTKSLRDYFSEYALIKYRTQVEIEWLLTLSESTEIDCINPFSNTISGKLRKIYQDFQPADALKVKTIESKTNHDVKAVEYYIADLLEKEGLSEVIPMLHFACTSEDINNLAYGLMLKHSMDSVIIPACKSLKNHISDKAETYRNIPLLSKTHGQPASPTTLGKEFFNVVARFDRQINQIKNQSILGKINGAVGNFNAHFASYPKADWASISQKFVESLGLSWNPTTTQIEPHDYMAELFHQMIRWNNIVLDLDRDIWLYISIGVFKQKPVEGEVGSSTMPHKVNPIDFENSEGNLGLANAIFDHLAIKLPISRWQRDLSDSTVQRNIGVAFGYSVLAYQSTLKGLSKLAVDEKYISAELSQAWPVLGEALQTVMRRYKIPDSYEKLKALTRGKQIDQQSIQAFIQSLDLPADVKKELMELKPETYIGNANLF
jgi:adenylosuccinate lyase